MQTQIINRGREPQKLIDMPVKIRLQRHGKKGKPFYWIVAADSRSKRDGKYLEKLGTYNPNINPAEINLDIDGTLQWLHNGAQPTDTARAILSYKGVMLKKHLAGGVKKGAFTEEQAEEKFNAWLEGKSKEVESKRTLLSDAEDKIKEEAFAAEKAVNEQRIADAIPVVEVIEEETTTTATEEEAPKKESIDDAAAEAAAPAKEEAPVVEAKKEEE